MTITSGDTASGLPAVILHQPCDDAGADDPIVFADDLSGNSVAFQVAGTDRPNMLITGATGAGVSAAIRVVVLEAARRGIAVRFCCPKRVAAAGLNGWPNVTVASTASEMAGLIGRTYADMMARYADIEEGCAEPEDYPRTLLVIDDCLLCTMLISDWWAGSGSGWAASGLQRIRLGARSVSCWAWHGAPGINMVAAGIGAASVFPEDLLENFGTRLALGRQTQQSAQMMFGDADIDRDIPSYVPGAGDGHYLVLPFLDRADDSSGLPSAIA